MLKPGRTGFSGRREQFSQRIDVIEGGLGHAGRRFCRRPVPKGDCHRWFTARSRLAHWLIQDAFPFADSVTSPGFRGSTQAVGQAIFHSYVLPFEAVSFLLLAALIGAVVLARKDDEP